MAIDWPITPGCGTLLLELELLMVAALSGETAAWFIGGGVAARGQISNWVLSSVVAKLSQNYLRFSLYLSLTNWAIAVVFEGVCMCLSVCVCMRESVCVCLCLLQYVQRCIPKKEQKKNNIKTHSCTLRSIYNSI